MTRKHVSDVQTVNVWMVNACVIVVGVVITVQPNYVQVLVVPMVNVKTMHVVYVKMVSPGKAAKLLLVAQVHVAIKVSAKKSQAIQVADVHVNQVSLV